VTMGIASLKGNFIWENILSLTSLNGKNIVVENSTLEEHSGRVDTKKPVTIQPQTTLAPPRYARIQTLSMLKQDTS
jgi:hypothetical protein